MLGPELLKEMEQIVKQVQENLKVAQDRRKSQADLKRTPKEFQVGEHVFIKVRPKKISLRLGSCAKLAPRYCEPFEILSRIGQVAYQLALPPNLKVHNVFHISVMKKYVHDGTHVIDLKCCIGGTRRRSSGGTRLYPREEGNYSAEPCHWTGEGAMEAP